jgi:hypothetical protein
MAITSKTLPPVKPRKAPKPVAHTPHSFNLPQPLLEAVEAQAFREAGKGRPNMSNIARRALSHELVRVKGKLRAYGPGGRVYRLVPRADGAYDLRTLEA